MAAMTTEATTKDPGTEAPETPLCVGIVGVGKMGISHLSMVKAHPHVQVVGVCDSSKFVLDILAKYTHVPVYTDIAHMLSTARLDAVIIATPTASHYQLVKTVLAQGVDVFCEKPLTLSPGESLELDQMTSEHGLLGQVGYHNRFVASFQEAHRLIQHGAIGRVVHARAEAHGPVVLKAKGGTWRARRDQGGSCLHDYAAHPIDILNWFLGAPEGVSGTVLGQIFSESTEDEVYSTIKYPDGVSAQLSVNWSDESQRKMTTKVTIWGTAGRIAVDRQECQTYLRDSADLPDGYTHGWNVKYTTDLTKPVWFYVRGEEYSAQIAHFIDTAIARRRGQEAKEVNTFAGAAVTDSVIDMLIRDAEGGLWTQPATENSGNIQSEQSGHQATSSWRMLLSKLRTTVRRKGSSR